MICLIQFPAKCFHVIAELWNDLVVAHKCTLLKTNSNPTSAIYQDHCCILSIYVRKPTLCIERSASLPGHSMVFWSYPSSQLFEPQSHSKEGRIHTQPLSSSDTLILSPSQSDIRRIKRVSLYQGGEWERYKLLKMPQIQAWWNVPCTWFVNPLPPFGTVGRFALKIAPTREWHNLVMKMSGLSGLKTLEKENGFFGAFSQTSTYWEDLLKVLLR